MARTNLYGTNVKHALRGFLLACLATSSHATTITLSISGVRNDRGHVLIAVCTRADFLRPHCLWKARVVAHKGMVDAQIENIPPGLYAAQAFHDENDNGRLDRSLLGLPREAMGFSRDAPMRLGPPRFDVASFLVGTQPVEIRFSLEYFR